MKQVYSVVIFCFILFSTIFASAQESVIIGALLDLSGPASFLGNPSKLVAEMAVDSLNKNGGFYGQKIELLVKDTKGNTRKASNYARRLITKHKVLAIIGPNRTGCGMAVKKIIKRYQIPTLMTVGGDIVISGDNDEYKYIFKTPQRSSTAIKVILKYLNKNNQNNIAIIYGSDGFGEDGIKSFELLAPAYKIKILAKEPCDPKSTELKETISKISKFKPEAIIGWTIGPAGPAIAINMNKAGLKIPLYQCHGLAGQDYIQSASDASEGNLMPSTKLIIADQLPDSDPQKKTILDFIQLYTQKYKYDSKYPITNHSGYAWDAIQLIFNGMKKMGLETDEIRDEIERTKNFIGLSGIYNFSKQDHNGLDTDSMVMVQIKNKKFVLAP